MVARTTAALFAAALCSAVQAQTSTAPALVDISPCMNKGSQAERYACYDELEAVVRAALANSAPAPVIAPEAPVSTAVEPADLPAATAASSGRSAVDTFGQTDTARVLPNATGEQELHDRIASLQEREPGRWLITLESGQVWYQSNSQRHRLRKGMEVRIYPSPLGGSYRMSQAGSETGFIQVTRVQ